MLIQKINTSLYNIKCKGIDFDLKHVKFRKYFNRIDANVTQKMFIYLKLYWQPHH